MINRNPAKPGQERPGLTQLCGVFDHLYKGVLHDFLGGPTIVQHPNRQPHHAGRNQPIDFRLRGAIALCQAFGQLEWYRDVGEPCHGD